MGGQQKYNTIRKLKLKKKRIPFRVDFVFHFIFKNCAYRLSEKLLERIPKRVNFIHFFLCYGNVHFLKKTIAFLQNNDSMVFVFSAYISVHNIIIFSFVKLHSFLNSLI